MECGPVRRDAAGDGGGRGDPERWAAGGGAGDVRCCIRRGGAMCGRLRRMRLGMAYVGDGREHGGFGGGDAGGVRTGRRRRSLKARSWGCRRCGWAADGAVYAATSPDGKVYRAGAAVGRRRTVVFDPAMTAEKPKYLWDLAVGRDGAVYVAAGAPAVVYRVRRGGKAEVLFKTADQHIRCLLMGADGTLWAGSDGAGVIYRIRRRGRRERSRLRLCGGAEGDYGAGDGCGRGMCMRRGWERRRREHAASAAGDGECRGDGYVSRSRDRRRRRGRTRWCRRGRRSTGLRADGRLREAGDVEG